MVRFSLTAEVLAPGKVAKGDKRRRGRPFTAKFGFVWFVALTYL